MSDTRNRLLNLLIVDDDEVDVMNVERAFKRANLEVRLHVAGDGVEGLARLRDGSVPSERRLILLDLNMPRMNGIEFLRALRADPALAAACVVVLTTSNEDRDRVEAYRLNVAGYLIKPITFVAFVELMATLNRYWAAVEMP